MKLEDAKSILRSTTASVSDRTTAGWLIADSPEASLMDLVECLKHRGQIAEAASIALYKRTNRPRADDEPRSLIADPMDWEKYLRQEKLV